MFYSLAHPWLTWCLEKELWFESITDARDTDHDSSGFERQKQSTNYEETDPRCNTTHWFYTPCFTPSKEMMKTYLPLRSPMKRHVGVEILSSTDLEERATPLTGTRQVGARRAERL